MRKTSLMRNEYYHIFNRSIAGFNIYNKKRDYLRFINLAEYYRFSNPPMNFAEFDRLNTQTQISFLSKRRNNEQLVDIVCYCIMPTHFHFLLRQNVDGGITDYIRLLENSYSRYFNISHSRKGPLWEGRFNGVHVETTEQLLHLTRYIHLNPTSAGLTEKPEEWKYSSYHEYIDNNQNESICKFRDVVNMQVKDYTEFVNDRKHFQRELSIIKSQLIDNYSG
ncbi:hypothetical protein GW889_00745 [Candidatus Berkelbacteria bacterium]|uniref:Transposase IS200-like domain-containing protein n=1 Tax=Candidatus Berkelbacteria bacterium CG10_big_fil_rev_8_21_14_0_10_43_14 TaxID=1974515 RepID=A0A2M6R9V4_9BACT|nr:hypothetical protein [Candidatus Berkelbacteria bacterium]OIP07248.1 MAG: hypothetical protein AUK41_00150 [Candidatus Berkelbacteria bacterium CG2_30_43_20]PIS06791.1 MAG: hypothetical protein COT79_02745 [Candidatus Berkelbacteria bacterium CG10_big_fil_rev_8_21_14_0_10_43_14]PIU87130.1 MAG: hypothetical protein COS66_02560 [Candidatus Berkelbacteria bacterium CG06_land_8_20_14_3_00_43_10]